MPARSGVGTRSDPPLRWTGAAGKVSTMTIRPVPQAGQAWAPGRPSTASFEPRSDPTPTGGAMVASRLRHRELLLVVEEVPQGGQVLLLARGRQRAAVLVDEVVLEVVADLVERVRAEVPEADLE